MAMMNRTASSILFALGIALVLIGLTTALGFTVAGIIASIAAVGALLYAGGLWFGETNRFLPSVLVFDHELRIAGGAGAGKPVSSQFPPSMRGAIERHCAAAADGRHSRFTCADRGRHRTFDAAPVLSGGGDEIAGVLVERAAAVNDPVSADAAVGVI